MNTLFLKIYATTDDVMLLLTTELGMKVLHEEHGNLQEIERKYRIKSEEMEKLGRKIPEKKIL